jgi:hypothetical protein
MVNCNCVIIRRDTVHQDKLVKFYLAAFLSEGREENERCCENINLTNFTRYLQ